MDPHLLLRELERHWHPHLAPGEVRRRLRRLLVEIHAALARGGEDARIVVHTYRRMVEGESVPPESMSQANRVLKELLGGIAFAVASILPGAFVTLPVLYALARHFQIDLLGRPSADAACQEALDPAPGSEAAMGSGPCARETERLRQAIDWIAAQPGDRRRLVDAACLRFGLSADEAEALRRHFSQPGESA